MKWPTPGAEYDRLRGSAEALIEASGDGRAIRCLGTLRRNPRQWGPTILRLAAESPVLKVALGVFLGVLAADAVREFLRGDDAERLAIEVDQAISAAGGPEQLTQLASPKVDALEEPASIEIDRDTELMADDDGDGLIDLLDTTGLF